MEERAALHAQSPAAELPIRPEQVVIFEDPLRERVLAERPVRNLDEVGHVLFVPEPIHLIAGMIRPTAFENVAPAVPLLSQCALLEAPVASFEDRAQYALTRP